MDREAVEQSNTHETDNIQTLTVIGTESCKTKLCKTVLVVVVLVLVFVVG